MAPILGGYSDKVTQTELAEMTQLTPADMRAGMDYLIADAIGSEDGEKVYIMRPGKVNAATVMTDFQRLFDLIRLGLAYAAPPPTFPVTIDNQAGFELVIKGLPGGDFTVAPNERLGDHTIHLPFNTELTITGKPQFISTIYAGYYIDDDAINANQWEEIGNDPGTINTGSTPFNRLWFFTI
jgi:hypothetical protein